MSLDEQSPINEPGFIAEVNRLRMSGELGESGRLVELFEFLAERGFGAEAASQAEMAEAVFGQTETNFDDATVRVYIHRLRKRLEEFYNKHGEGRDGVRLTIPPGIYALRLMDTRASQLSILQSDDVLSDETATDPPHRRRRAGVLLIAAAILVAVAAFFLGRTMSAGAATHQPNALWQPFLKSDRPILLVLGDYYIFGEINPVRPEDGRLIRDFRVNSVTDLVRLQELLPDQFGDAEDVGLNYLPFSVSYAMQELMPVLASGSRETRVVPASDFTTDMLSSNNVIYLGLFSGMGPLEGTIFNGSGFALGESYDELIDVETEQTYTSEEARRLVSPSFYQDYGYVTRFQLPSGAFVAAVAGARETALRDIAPLVARSELPPKFGGLASGEDALEVVFQITGQQGTGLSEKMLVARERDVPR